MDAAPVSAVALLDRDVSRRGVLATALRAAGITVSEAHTPEEVTATGCGTVLFAFDRAQPGALRGLVTLLRGTVPGRQVLAVIPGVPLGVPLGAALGDVPDGREVLATAQAAGCDGCLVYAHPDEVTAVLRACVPGVAS